MAKMEYYVSFDWAYDDSEGVPLMQKDYKGRDIIYKDGKRVLHKPTKKIEDCFQCETISWQFECVDKRINEPIVLTVASGERERLIKKDAEYDIENIGRKVKR